MLTGLKKDLMRHYELSELVYFKKIISISLFAATQSVSQHAQHEGRMSRNTSSRGFPLRDAAQLMCCSLYGGR